MTEEQFSPMVRNLMKLFPPGSSLLDYQCGQGTFLSSVQEYFSAIGIDTSMAALQKARTKVLKSHFILGDETTLSQIKAESFDVITAFNVLGHVSFYSTLLSEFRRLLKRQGILCISVPNAESWARKRLENRWSGYEDAPVTLLTEREWRIACYDAGFTFKKRYSSGLLSSPKPDYQLNRTWKLLHYVTKMLAFASFPLPLSLNDTLYLSFAKIE